VFADVLREQGAHHGIVPEPEVLHTSTGEVHTLHEDARIRNALLALGILNGVVHYERTEDGWVVALDEEKITRARNDLYTMPQLHLDGRHLCDRCGVSLSLRCFEVEEGEQEKLVLLCPGCEEASSNAGVDLRLKEVPACADDCLWAILKNAGSAQIQELVPFPEPPQVTKLSCGGELVEDLGCTREAAKHVHRWVQAVVKASVDDKEALMGLPEHIQIAVGNLDRKDIGSMTLKNLQKIRDENGRYVTLSLDQVPTTSLLGETLHRMKHNMHQHLGHDCVNKDTMIFVMTDKFDLGSLQGTPFHVDQGWGGNLLVGFDKDDTAPHAIWLFLRITSKEEHERLDKAVESHPSLKKKFPMGMFPGIFVQGGKVLELGDTSVAYQPGQVLTPDEMMYLQSACEGLATVKEHRHGEVMLVPPGNIHTVTTLRPCVKIAYNWVGSPLLLATMHYMVACRLLGPRSSADYIGLAKKIEQDLLPLRAHVKM
jgi:hypothetical protein